MSWSVQAVILGCEMALGYVLGRVFIPYFRWIKTGKFDFYIGDRLAKDGSEPKFGGAVIMLCVIFGVVTGVIFYDSEAVLSLESGEFSRRAFIALGGVLMLTAIGLSEDYVKEKKLGIGMKPLYKLFMEYLICLGVCVALRYCGGLQTAVLLPFHWGYIQFGRLFYLLYPLEFLLTLLFKNQNAAKGFCSGLLECTKGALELSRCELGFFKLPLITFIITFGGISVIAQSLAFLKQAGVKSKFFITAKLIQAVISFALCAVFQLIFAI